MHPRGDQRTLKNRPIGVAVGARNHERLVEQTLMDDTEQVKISWPARPPRAVLTASQMAEQLVEEPVVSASSCVLVPQMVVASQSEFQQHSVEHNVDIPVHGGVRRRAANLQEGFLPGQSPTARGWLDGGGLQGFPAGQEFSSASCSWWQRLFLSTA